MLAHGPKILKQCDRHTLLGKQTREVASGISEGALVDVGDAVKPLLALLEFLDRPALDLKLAPDLC